MTYATTGKTAVLYLGKEVAGITIVKHQSFRTYKCLVQIY